MEVQQGKELIVEIDDEVERLIQEINAAPGGQKNANFADELKGVLIDSVLGPFGLSQEMFEDRDGGHVTTLHNFEQGVTANTEDEARYAAFKSANDNKIERADYSDVLPAEREKIFGSDTSGFVEDAYTGRSLPKDKTTHRDHVVSAAEIERSSKGHFAQTREERVATANLDENKVWTQGSLNSSKQDKKLDEWAADPSTADASRTNAEHFGIDPVRQQQVRDKAQAAVDRAQNIAVAKRLMTDFAVQGGIEAGKVVARQVLGLVVKDVVEGLVVDVKHVATHGFASVAALADLIGDRIRATLARIRERWADYLKDGVAAGLTGLLSSLVTMVINSFITTAKRIVTIIREGVLALMRSIKLVLMPPPGMPAKVIAMEVLKLMTGAVTTTLGLLLQDGITKLIQSVPVLVAVAEPLGAIVTGAISGVAGLLVMLAFDHVKAAIAFRNKALADVHREHNVTLLRMKQTVVLLATAHTYIESTSQQLRITFEADWREVREIEDEADVALDGYAGSVDSLKGMLESL